MTGYAHGARYLGRLSPLAISRQALDQAIARLRVGPGPAARRAGTPACR